MIKRVLYERRGLSLAAMLALCLAPLMASADFAKTNPVTGETENYTWKFVGTDTWNGTGYWQDSDGNNPTGVPGKSGDGNFEPFFFDGSTVSISASMSVEGWDLRMGLFNGATLTMNNLQKFQDGTMWVTVDESSKLTIAANKNDKYEGDALNLYSAREAGIEWTCALSNAGGTGLPFNYYLAGHGTVAFTTITAANCSHTIKRADVTLSEVASSKTVRSKTLVSFASSTSTFLADATIKVKNADGSALKEVNLDSVTATTPTLTASGNVGDCELVQTSTGVVLYYVDYATDYTPSININFTNGAGNGLTTSADVGLSGYEVPGTSWNNFVVANNATFNTVNAIDSTGAASVASGVSVSISGTRGHWSCSTLAPASNPLHGYIDEESGKPTPTVTISGIPYEKYRVLVYHSTDSPTVPFGYDTINGTNYTYVENVLVEGETAWGDSGANQGANAITEGGNVLVTGELSGSTLTVVGHRAGGANNARGCIAAIQIIEVAQEIGENDLEIPVNGETDYPVNEAKNLSGTVYLTGSGTLTLSGSAQISAATIHIAKNVTLNINAARLDATTFTGSGTVVYDTTAPVEGKGWAESAWSGTVWIKNQSVSSFEGTKFGNACSTVRFTGVTGFLQTSSYNSSTYVHTVPLELVDEGNTIAFTYNNGWGGNLVKINTLKGTGTLKTQGSGAGEHIYIVDASGFTGVFNLTAKYVYVGGEQPDYSASTNPNGKLEIRSGVTMTVPSDKTWTANGGFVVDGTLNVDGSLASSHTTKAVSGSGMVSFIDVPSPTGNAWWKNAAWTGTVEIYSVQTINGNYVFNDYGNSNSTLKLTDCSGWLKPNYTCVPALEIGGTFSWNDGSSGLNNTFKVTTLKGNGTISIPNQGAATAVWQITGDWSQFTGVVVGNNSAAKRVLVFGPTLPTTITAGNIYISEGATLDLDNASGAWWGVGMCFVVDGTVKASSRDKWGGGTAMTLGDTGVLELVTGSSYVDDSEKDFSNVTGTGTVRYTGTNWRSLPDGNNMFATTLSIELENDTGVVFKGSGECSSGTIGSLFGTKNLRNDLGGYNKALTVKQAKDGVWSGIISSGDRLDTLTVDPGESTTGTLTIAGTHTADNKLIVNGSVNLTGTWVGATTVSGTICGTGTLDGSLTFSDGATFMATNTPLTVTGNINVPASGVVTVDVSRVTFGEDTITILENSDGFDYSDNFTLIGSVPEGYVLKEQFGALVLTKSSGGDIPEPAGAQARFWVANVANADVNVYTNGVSLALEGECSGYNIYFPNGDADATIVYSAKDGYVIVGQTRYSVQQVTDDLAFPSDGADIPSMSVTNVNDLTEVAFVTDSEGVNTLYKTLNGAFEAVKSNETVTLIRDAVLANNVTLSFPVIVAGTVDGCKMGGPLTLDTGSSLTLLAGVVITNELEDAIVVTDHLVTIKYPTALGEDAPKVVPPEGYDAETTDNGDGTSTISFKVHEEPETGYTAWQDENNIDGDWDAETDGIANVFRYVFDKPSETFQLITNITFNADAHAVIWTPQMVNDTESAEFDIFVVPSDDLVFDENDETGKVSLSRNGETEIDEDLHEARFFRLKAEKKPQE